MGDDVLDDLARTLARPMSRRRAIRLFGAAVGAAAVPGLRPRAARARAVERQDCGGRVPGCGAPGICSQGTVCGADVPPCGCNKGCCQNTGDPDVDRNNAVCCAHNPQTEGTGSWCCPAGFTCGSGANTGTDPNCKCEGKVDPRTGECNCPPDKFCGNTCCLDHERCENGECVSCPDEDRCGSNCCAEGSVCRNPSRGLCCVKTWKPCQAGSAGVVKCCPPKDTCCFNQKTKTYKCCGPGVECEDGTCKCTKDEKRCGEDCCKKGEVCSNGKCCKKGEVNCDGKCCKKHLCVASRGKKVCCPIERIATPSSGPVCCPPGTVPDAGSACCPPDNPGCCDFGDLTQFCRKGSVCVNGVCQ